MLVYRQNAESANRSLNSANYAITVRNDEHRKLLENNFNR